jgi:molybdenum cofactor biosynthesis enzyme MoaA
LSASKAIVKHRRACAARSRTSQSGAPSGTPGPSERDRLRLTADGQLRACLFARDEVDLRGLMRAGGGDSELVDLIHQCVLGKPTGHGIGEPGFLGPSRPMSAIGG